METGMGTSPRIRLNFRDFLSSLIRSAGSRPSVTTGRMGCSCLTWPERSGLLGEESVEGELMDLREGLWSLDGRDLVKGIFRLSEKLFLFGFDRSMTGACSCLVAERAVV